jgi:hypothetical protein
MVAALLAIQQEKASKSEDEARQLDPLLGVKVGH